MLSFSTFSLATKGRIPLDYLLIIHDFVDETRRIGEEEGGGQLEGVGGFN